MGGAGLPKPITRLEMSGFQISCPSGVAWISIWEGRPHSPVSQMVLRGDHFSDDFVDYAINLERIILLSDMIMAGHEPPRGINRFALDDITRFAGKKPIWID